MNSARGVSSGTTRGVVGTSEGMIITELIEKTKILSEELKNSNRIASQLMEENKDLRG